MKQREILFGAIRLDNGEWVEGCPVVGADGRLSEMQIVTKDRVLNYVIIDPATLPLSTRALDGPIRI